jgi:hypothetical protein
MLQKLLHNYGLILELFRYFYMIACCHFS